MMSKSVCSNVCQYSLLEGLISLVFLALSCSYSLSASRYLGFPDLLGEGFIEDFTFRTESSKTFSPLLIGQKWIFVFVPIN